MLGRGLRIAFTGAACALAGAAPAAAGLLPSVPSLPGTDTVTQSVTGTIGTITGTDPGAVTGTATGTVTGTVDQITGSATTDVTGTVAGTVDQVTGTVGGLIGDPTQTVTGTLDGLLSGSGGGTLPVDTVTKLMYVLLGGDPAATSGGAASSGGKVVGGANGSQTVVDGRAPRATFRVLTHLRDVGRTGRLVLRVASDEPGVVAFTGALRPGKGIVRKGKAERVNRKLVHFRSVMLGFRKAGALRVTLVLSRTAQRALGKARDGRISLQALAVDLARNQHRANVKQKLLR